MKPDAPNASAGKRRSAFTLLELLVSMAVLSLLVLLLIAMTEGASRLWRDGERKREAACEARAALGAITADLHSAVLTGDSSTLLVTPAEPGKEGGGLFFLVSHPRERRDDGAAGNKGDLCAAGYFVAADPDGSGVEHLYRFHAPPGDVARALAAGDLKELYAGASPANTGTTELLARHITRLEVRPAADREGGGPELLLVSVAALGSSSSRLVASGLLSPQRRESLLREHLQRYTTLVRLPPRRQPFPAP